MSFHFRHRAEAVLRRAARTSKVVDTVRHSTPIKMFYTSSRSVLDSTSQHSTASKIGLSVTSSLLVPLFVIKLLPKIT